MLPLLDYSAKKEQMLQEYYAQLYPQFDAQEPWEDAHTWAILTGEVEVLLRETTHLYVDLVRTDEFHHYCSVTQPEYFYAEAEQKLEELFTNLRALLQKVLELAGLVESHGDRLQGKENAERCLREVEILLADESPMYATTAFQALLEQSLRISKLAAL